MKKLFITLIALSFASTIILFFVVKSRISSGSAPIAASEKIFKDEPSSEHSELKHVEGAHGEEHVEVHGETKAQGETSGSGQTEVHQEVGSADSSEKNKDSKKDLSIHSERSDHIKSSSSKSGNSQKMSASHVPSEKKESKTAEHSQHEKKSPAKGPHLSQTSKLSAGVSFIQIKAILDEGQVSLDQAKKMTKKIEDSLGLETRLCRVNLKSKGKWIRVQVGPLKKSTDAKDLIPELVALSLDPESPVVVKDKGDCL